MSINRRSFLTSAAALGLAAASPLVRGTPGKSVVSSSPNPRMEHLSLSHAKRLCEKYKGNIPEEGGMLDLREFRTASPAALASLAEKSWTWLDLGIANVTDQTALALSRNLAACVTLHHVEQISPVAVAVLFASSMLFFENVAGVDPAGIEELANLLRRTADDPQGVISLGGPYRVDLVLAKALAQLPCALCLEPDAGESAFEGGCAEVLSRHRGPHLGLSRATLPSGELGNEYSIRFAKALSGNPKKRVRVVEGRHEPFLIELTNA